MSILCCYYNNGVYFSFSYGQSQPYALTNYNSLRFLLYYSDQYYYVHYDGFNRKSISDERLTLTK